MKYKYNGQWYDVTVKALDSLPIGAIIMTVIPSAVNGWIFCDGRAISRTEYSDLFDVIGTTYGAGDGSTTFNVPDMTGRVPVCLDGTDADFNVLGATGGSKELQAHSHTLNQMVGFTEGSSNIKYTVSYGPTRENTGICTDSVGTGNSGNLQPYMVVKFIIKAKNSTPAMASIVNDYSTSTQDGYSCKYNNEHLGGIVLYNSDTGGSNTTIQLNDSAINYSYIEILFRTNDGAGYKGSSGLIYNPNGTIQSLSFKHSVSGVIYIKQAEVNTNGNQISFITANEWYVSQGSTVSVTNSSNIYIYRVIGWK